MNELQPHALAARVVAWHNRNPLARRIRATEVHSVGYVAVPLLLPPGDALTGGDANLSPATDPLAEASLRERAMARIQKEAPDPTSGDVAAAARNPRAPQPAQDTAETALTAAFGEAFIPGLTPQKVAAWASTHGVMLGADPTESPVRRIATDADADAQRICERWLLTAQIEIGLLKSRVLLGSGAPAAVLGRRLLSPLRVAALAALLLALAIAVLLLSRPDLQRLMDRATASEAGPGPVLAAARAASAASELAPATAIAAALQASAAPGPLPGASASELAAMAAPPANVDPALGRVALPSLGPYIDEKRRGAQARAASASATTPAGGPADVTAAAAQPTPQTRATTQVQTAQAAPALPPLTTGPAYAVSTQPLRTRTESEQFAAAMRDLLRTPGGRPLKVEVMPAGNDWRVVSWPYLSQLDADRARAMLAQRGMKVEVIAF